MSKPILTNCFLILTEKKKEEWKNKPKQISRKQLTPLKTILIDK